MFTSADGYLLEGPTSTLLIARRGADGTRRLVTPLRQQGILAGTSQSVIFAAAQAEGWALGYGPLVPADLEERLLAEQEEEAAEDEQAEALSRTELHGAPPKSSVVAGRPEQIQRTAGPTRRTRL